MRHRWQRRREPANHTDDWLMTYADMITLLLCFFAIFLSVSLNKKNIPHKIQAPLTVEHPAKPPDMLEGNLPFHGVARAARPTEKFSDAQPVETIVPMPSLSRPAVAEVKPQEPAANPKNSGPLMPTAARAPEAPPQTAARPSASLPEIVDHLKAQGPADIQQKGDRITTLAISSAAFFDRGSAALSDSGKAILRDVAVNLKSDKFRDYQIMVEGHTDDTPIDTPQFPSNWELSTARAASVVRFLLEQGIPAQQLRAAGYADTFPVVPNRDAAGNPIPENQARNRRVVITLEKIEKAAGGKP